MNLSELISYVSEKVMLKEIKNDVMPNLYKACIQKPYGEGGCNIFRLGQIAALVSIDLSFFEALRLEFSSDFRIMTWFSDIGATTGSENERLRLSPFEARMPGDSKNAYDTFFDKSCRLNGIIVIFSPEKYVRYVREKYGLDVEKTIMMLDKVTSIEKISEMKIISEQIRHHASEEAGIMSALYYESKLHEIISIYTKKAKQKLNTDNAPRPVLCVRNDDILKISEITEYLCSYPGNNDTLETLAKKACMSPAKLKYAFKEVTGCTVSAFRERIRMESGRALLVSTDKTVKEIATELGFRKASSYTDLFRRHTGLTPTEYRELF